jgi:hypothetical protein
MDTTQHGPVVTHPSEIAEAVKLATEHAKATQAASTETPPATTNINTATTDGHSAAGEAVTSAAIPGPGALDSSELMLHSHDLRAILSALEKKFP